MGWALSFHKSPNSPARFPHGVCCGAAASADNVNKAGLDKVKGQKGASTMAGSSFGGLGGLGGALGGLMGGLARSGLVPKDTPEGQVLNAQTELADLQRQETELLVEIGKAAYAANPSACPQDAKLRLIAQNMAAASAALGQASEAQREADAARAAQEAAATRAECGHKNPDDVRYCQDCGRKLGETQARMCAECGAQLAPGARFCGGCGAKQGL
jgi:hypothetical protein